MPTPFLVHRKSRSKQWLQRQVAASTSTDELIGNSFMSLIAPGPSSLERLVYASHGAAGRPAAATTVVLASFSPCRFGFRTFLRLVAADELSSKSEE